MAEIEKNYVFERPDGAIGLADLFAGRSKLIIQHIMFDPSWQAPCPGCSAALDETAPGLFRHLQSRDTSFAGISRAPYARLSAARTARGWQVDWYSSYGSDFNYDFCATLDPAVTPPLYNFEPPREPVTESEEVPGLPAGRVPLISRRPG
jgi:predicted dithiol-disulfide oxidoreductase (DUF899 family)